MTPILSATDPAVIEKGFRERKPLFEGAEVTATKILKEKSKSLANLARELENRPLTGSEVKKIVSEA